MTPKLSSLVRDKSDLRHIFQFDFTNAKGLRLQAYSWQVATPKAHLILIHGLTSHALNDFLYHTFPENVSKNTTEQEVIEATHITYQGSFIEKLNIANISVFTYDQQGHGASEAWEDSPCNVESINDLVYNAIQFVLLVESLFNVEHRLPVYIGGISLGAGVTLKAVQLMRYIAQNNALPEDPFYRSLMEPSKARRGNSGATEAQSKPVHALLWPTSTSSEEVVQSCKNIKLQGFIALCPPIVVGSVKKQLTNMILIPFSDYASSKWPTWKVGDVKKNTMFPWTEYAKHKENSLLYTGKLPCRMAAEVLNFGKTIQADIKLLANDENAQPLRSLFVHSKQDELCDFKGTADFVRSLNAMSHNATLIEPENMWHYLLVEPGADQVIEKTVKWFESEDS